MRRLYLAVLITLGVATVVFGTLLVASIVSQANQTSASLAVDTSTSETLPPDYTFPTPSITPDPPQAPSGVTVPPTPKPTPTPTPTPTQLVAAPPVNIPVPKVSCPTGVVRLSIDSAALKANHSSFNTNDPTIYSYEATASATLTNATTSTIKVNSMFTPTLYGLNVGGTAEATLFSSWRWTPPPGQPRPTYIELKPGATLQFDASYPTVNPYEAKAITYWYSSPSNPSFVVSWVSADWTCSDPAAEPASVPRGMLLN